MNRCAAAAVALLVVTFPLAATADCEFADPNCVTFVPLGSLDGGAFESTVSGLSWDGLVAVGTSTSQNSTPRGEGFLWDPGTGIQGLGSLPGGAFQSQANAIHKTASGSWIGGGASSTLTGSDMEAAIYFTGSGTWEALGSLAGGSPRSMIYALDASGEIEAGSSSSPESGGTQQQAAVRNESAWEALETPPNAVPRGDAYGVDALGTVIVGLTATASSGSNKREAARWSAGSVEILRFPGGGGAEGQARAIDPSGEFIVGQARNSQNLLEAFAWSQGEMAGLGDLDGGSFESEARAVATDGNVVVGRGTTAAGPRAFIWKPEEGIRSLREVFEELSGTDLGTWKLEEATAISRDGRVVAGNGRNPDNQPEAWVLTLPEPTAIDLQCAVILALAGLARTRRSGSHSRAGSPASGNELAWMGSRIQPSGPRSNS